MDTGEKTNEDSRNLGQSSEVLVAKKKTLADVELNLTTLKNFFQLSGGSVLYCLSAAFVVYGIFKIMGPILSAYGGFKDALPSIITLFIYELALLVVFILIVSKKVVDDAISILIFIAIFLVGTTIALGSVADKDISASFIIGLIVLIAAFFKLGIMRRFARVPFGVLSFLGVSVLMACNCFGPNILARSIAAQPSQEPARRELWLWILLGMLIGAGLVLIEAIREKQQQITLQYSQRAFLHRPIMVYVFVLILFIASGIHQYATAFTFALERVICDFVPLIAVVVLLLLEILRHSGKKFGVSEFLISLVPLAVTLLAIKEKSVLESGEFGLGLICYPPVILILAGLSIAALALYHRRYSLVSVTIAYGLGVVLTAGFNPEMPHTLNTHAFFGLLLILTFSYGIIMRNQYICLIGTIILCIGLSCWEEYLELATSYGLTEVGGIAGVFGLCVAVLYILFGKKLNKIIQIVGVLYLAGFLFDYLPNYTHWRYLVVLGGIILVASVMWYRTRDTLFISILCTPFLIKVFKLAKSITYWRFVILGFLLLGAGTIVSLFKQPRKNGRITINNKSN